MWEGEFNHVFRTGCTDIFSYILPTVLNVQGGTESISPLPRQGSSEGTQITVTLVGPQEPALRRPRLHPA